jgi:hypothetical protein
MEKVEITMNDIWMQTKPKVHRNKKKYNRKDKKWKSKEPIK